MIEPSQTGLLGLSVALAEIIPSANPAAEYTAPDIVNRKILDFFADGTERN